MSSKDTSRISIPNETLQTKDNYFSSFFSHFYQLFFQVFRQNYIIKYKLIKVTVYKESEECKFQKSKRNKNTLVDFSCKEHAKME